MAYDATALQDDLDFLAGAYNDLVTLFGDGTGDTLSGRWAGQVAAFLAAEDLDAAVNLAARYQSALERLKCPSELATVKNGPLALLAEIVTGIKAQCGNNIDTQLTTDGIKIHPYCRAALDYNNGGAITATNVFALQTLMGSILKATGSWAAYVVGVDIDKALYAPANLEVYVWDNVTIGGADVILTITCKKTDGSTDVRQVTVPQGSVDTYVADIGNGTTDKYIGIQTVAASGGTNADRVGFRSKQLRTLPW